MEKKSRKRLLPSVDELAQQSKRRKGMLSGVRDAHTRMKDTNFVDVSRHDVGMLSEDELACWLVAKLGFLKTIMLYSAVNMVPESVTAKQRLEIICQCCGISESEYDELRPLLDAICEKNVEPRVAAFEDPLVLAPPISHCYDCDRRLTCNHVTTVKCYTCTGVRQSTKVTLRCKECGISYNYAQFGDKSGLGFRYYPTRRKYVEVSDTVYFHRQLLELQCSLANHSWVSFQGFCESYNDAFDLPHELELTPRTVGEAFYSGELEDELRTIGKVDYRFKCDSDREVCMEMVEEHRRDTTYPHPESQCTADCKSRGCGRLWVTDGIWKTVFPHCMFRVEQSVASLPSLNLPDVCTNSPEKEKAFCTAHCQLLQEKAPHVPLGLKDFLKHCGISQGDHDKEKDPADMIDKAINQLHLPGNSVGQSAATSQGTFKLVNDNPELLSQAVYADVDAPTCRKDTGKGKKLRKWSRGHQFIVRAGGHIDTWQPLYKSESPSQVFFILLQWLLSIVKPSEKLPTVTLAYDNICNIDRMKVAQNPLPFPAPLDRLWLDIEKVIDSFHLPNHVSASCREKFSPSKLKADNPNYNTQAGEQTFVWVGKYKHILCSMNKVHHLFYLHRMVRRRNSYSAKCYRNGRKPLLPKKQ